MDEECRMDFFGEYLQRVGISVGDLRSNTLKKVNPVNFLNGLVLELANYLKGSADSVKFTYLISIFPH